MMGNMRNIFEYFRHVKEELNVDREDLLIKPNEGTPMEPEVKVPPTGQSPEQGQPQVGQPADGRTEPVKKIFPPIMTRVTRKNLKVLQRALRKVPWLITNIPELGGKVLVKLNLYTSQGASFWWLALDFICNPPEGFDPVGDAQAQATLNVVKRRVFTTQIAKLCKRPESRILLALLPDIRQLVEFLVKTKLVQLIQRGRILVSDLPMSTEKSGTPVIKVSLFTNRMRSSNKGDRELPEPLTIEAIKDATGTLEKTE